MALAGCAYEAGYDPLAAGQGAEEAAPAPEMGRAIITTTLGQREVGYEVIDGIAVTEGDIELGPVEELESAEKGAGVNDRDLRWPNRKVPYVFDGSLSGVVQARADQAIHHWEDMTDMDFVIRTNEPRYLRIVTSNRCQTSGVGRPTVDGQMYVRLSHGRTTSEIVGIGFMRSNQLTFGWYSDGTVSGGSRTKLDSTQMAFPYVLPAGRTHSQIVGIDIRSNDEVVTWFSNLTYYVGRVDNLGVSGPFNYSLPLNYSAARVRGIAFAPSGTVVTWYDDGKRSIGTEGNLAALSGPVSFTTSNGLSPGAILDTIIEDDDDIVAYYEIGQGTLGGQSIGDLANLGAVQGVEGFRATADCSTGAAIHELGHVVGLWHEQTRCDRTDHIIVNWGNIEPGKEYNWNPQFPAAQDCSQVRQLASYDITSIMHYGSDAFSIQPGVLNTMTRLDGTTFAQQLNGLTVNDRRSVLELYGFSPAVGQTPTSIVGIAADDTNTYTWHSNATISVGRSYDHDRIAAAVPFTLPPGRTASQIVAMDMRADGHVFTWFSDMKVFEGNTTDLDHFNAVGATYTLPAGQSIFSVQGITISSNNTVYYYFTDGTRTSGSTTSSSNPVNYSPATGHLTSQISEMTISKANGRTYVWYTNFSLSIGNTTDLDLHQQAW